MARDFNKFRSARQLRPSPWPSRAPRSRTRRRGTVLIMVVGVLAMLFIIGATQLLVARFERDAAQQKRSADNLQGVATSMALPAMSQLRQDVVGSDSVPYNADSQVYTVDNPPVEDYADFAGLSLDGFGKIQPLRTGDLLLASPEPYLADPLNKVFRWFALSWAMDTCPAWMQPLNQFPPLNSLLVALPLSPVNSDYTFGDADGDGMLDSAPLAVGVSGAFGGTYQLFQRIVPHGGMVLFDRMTHPALLAQVIHPSDDNAGNYHSRPWQLFQYWMKTDDDEWRLRRRGMLPGDVGDLQILSLNDLRRLLPYTLGYESPNSAWDSVTPHWWPVDPRVPKDVQWWQARMTPGLALTENYKANDDMYDRQHLITTRSNDDLLRRQRNEKGGTVASAGPPPTNATPGMFVANATTASEAPLRPFYYVVSPEASAGVDFPGAGDIQHQPPEAYGISPYTSALEFNKPGLRTPFSLRDVLVNPTNNGGYQASYRRAMQLTAYYLAMLQHTALPENQRLLQAAQLAVNTIDFADNGDLDNDGVELTEDDPITWFQYSSAATGVTFNVYGVEKQPYFTEAYARIIQDAQMISQGVYIWVDAPSNASVYAVELYNPYEVPLVLDDYMLVTSLTTLDLGPVEFPPRGVEIPAGGYVVIANQNPPGVTGGVGGGLYVPTSGSFRIGHKDAVKLVRKSALLVTAGSPPTPQLSANVVVDQITATGDLGNDDDMWARPRFIKGEDEYADVNPSPTAVRRPTGLGDKLVRDSSLQRHKEWIEGPNTGEFRPSYWHFTIGRQIQFPLAWNEDPVNNATGYPTTGGWLLPDDDTRPLQHNLLGTSDWTNQITGLGSLSNQQIVAAEFAGQDIVLEAAPATPQSTYKDFPVAGFPVLIADRGFDLQALNSSLLGAAAFPTTGTLLLVTRDGPTTFNGTAVTTPLSVTLGALSLAELQKIDIGHMPVLSNELTTDLTEGRGRLSVPWGQLVFDYFTALPLEELTNPNFLLAVDDVTYENYYLQAFGSTSVAASMYPMVERVTGAASPYGPSVRGRVNINFAPWWVLDGLPVLWDQWNLDPTVYGMLEQVPVVQMRSDWLDPLVLNAGVPQFQVGSQLIEQLLDNTPAKGLTSEDYSTISPYLARYMVSYRERHPVDGVDASNGGEPGFLTVGALAGVIPSIPFQGGYKGNALPVSTLAGLRTLPDPTITGGDERPRPFSYLGYLQMVAPIVRLQDWATVKGHVFTIYSVIGDTSDPPVWLRSQTTVDRTRCLYTNDLPDRILQSDVLGFFNAVTDQ